MNAEHREQLIIISKSSEKTNSMISNVLYAVTHIRTTSYYNLIKSIFDSEIKYWFEKLKRLTMNINDLFSHFGHYEHLQEIEFSDSSDYEEQVSLFLHACNHLILIIRVMNKSKDEVKLMFKKIKEDLKVFNLSYSDFLEPDNDQIKTKIYRGIYSDIIFLSNFVESFSEFDNSQSIELLEEFADFTKTVPNIHDYFHFNEGHHRVGWEDPESILNE